MAESDFLRKGDESLRAIREIKDINCEQFVTALNGVIDNMRDKKISDVQVFNIEIQALAIKYWHENMCRQLNVLLNSRR